MVFLQDETTIIPVIIKKKKTNKITWEMAVLNRLYTKGKQV